jgi:cytochrome c oxidase accessory protein FixG
MTAPVAVGRVLPTMNEDGSRRWIRPRLSTGKFWVRRRAVAYALMVVFFAIPYLRMNGLPLVLLDLPLRRFTILGSTFFPTDTLLLMLLMLSILIAIFLMTALAGRVWCGWGCPQTVYMEFLFRPVERLFEGGRSGSLQLDRDHGRGQLHPRRLAKYAVYLVLSLFLAHTFLAYFVGIDRLVVWVRSSPVEHPTSFLVMAVTTAAIMADFTWFREQTCAVACPYGRFQSVLLDRQSLIVAYDRHRGEPRGHGKERAAGSGDCIDCGACVITCPTGIDIRDGLQMECIHCTQCADACDAIMSRVGRPPGLIRYSSRATLEGERERRLRPRVVLYPAALSLAFGGFVVALVLRTPADITVMRGMGAPFAVESDGRVANQLRVKITNRDPLPHRYTVSLEGVEPGTMIAPQNPIAVAPGRTEMMDLFVMLPASAFHDGERKITVHIADGAGYTDDVSYRLVGPDHHDAGESHDAPGRERR